MFQWKGVYFFYLLWSSSLRNVLSVLTFTKRTQKWVSIGPNWSCGSASQAPVWCKCDNQSVSVSFLSTYFQARTSVTPHRESSATFYSKIWGVFRCSHHCVIATPKFSNFWEWKQLPILSFFWKSTLRSSQREKTCDLDDKKYIRIDLICIMYLWLLLRDLTWNPSLITCLTLEEAKFWISSLTPHRSYCPPWKLQNDSVKRWDTWCPSSSREFWLVWFFEKRKTNRVKMFRIKLTAAHDDLLAAFVTIKCPTTTSDKRLVFVLRQKCCQKKHDKWCQKIAGSLIKPLTINWSIQEKRK